MSEVRGSGQEETPRVQASGGQEEIPCVRDQGQPGEATLSLKPGAVTLKSHPRPRPGLGAGRSNLRSRGCAGTGGPRGAIPS